MSTSLIPDTAPFNEEQRSWLNGFFAGLMGFEDSAGAEGEAGADTSPAADASEEDFPWHDPSLEIDQRMELAEGKPLEGRLMAAMAQLDCGSCGYLCKTYSEAIASGEETNLTLCSPGGKATAKRVKQLVNEMRESGGGGPRAGAASGNGAVSDNGVRAPRPAGGQPSPAPHGYSRKRPFAAPLLESRRLNGEGSAKDTRHVVLDLAGSGLTYQVGDALGVYPTNCDELVGRIIQHLGADSSLPMETASGETRTLHSILSEECSLGEPSDELLELLRERSDDPAVRKEIDRLLDGGAEDGFDVLDALQVAREVTLSVTELVEQLEPLNPRLYSIASSQSQVGEQVHLTVGTVRYEARGRARKGAASTMLADRIRPGQKVRVFVQPNHGGFTVPADPAAPMIMVGPGTGIAPFLAFLQQRAATGASGPNWLFFGDQHQACDFLYRDPLQQYVASGLLSRLDTAFSRDGEQKVYVQDRMREQAADLWRWLEHGACFYVCGDASRMAADVDRALREVICEAGGLTPDAANEYVQTMAAEGRYARDVY